MAPRVLDRGLAAPRGRPELVRGTPAAPGRRPNRVAALRAGRTVQVASPDRSRLDAPGGRRGAAVAHRLPDRGCPSARAGGGARARGRARRRLCRARLRGVRRRLGPRRGGARTRRHRLRAGDGPERAARPSARRAARSRTRLLPARGPWPRDAGEGMNGLRLPRHRGTTANLCSAYPFAAEADLGAGGAYLGTNVLTGGSGFAYDPFEAYRSGLVTNPNVLIAGEPGTGKSATAKCIVYRACGAFGRWVAIADPKGEYGPLADALGLDVIRLHPGGSARINPLDPGPGGAVGDPDETARRQAVMVTTLLGTVLRRDLTPLEDA